MGRNGGILLPRFGAHMAPIRILLIPTLLIAFAFNAAADLTFEQHAVVARVSPGAQTAWFATTNDFDYAEGATIIRQYAFLLSDSDGDGLVRFDLGTVIMPLRGTWLVVDMTSRQIASGVNLGPNPGSGSTPRHFPRGAFLRDAAGHFTHLSIDWKSAAWMTYLWVRPNVGAWFSFGGDGSQLDLDGAGNGRLFFDTSSMRPLAPTPPPPLEGFVAGDLLLGLDYFGAKWFGDEVSTHFAETIGPGVLGFGITRVWHSERGGALRVAVIRTGGSDGTVSVNYATADGTLRAGINYVATAGRLTFGPGELIKSIEIPVTNDSVPSGDGSFQIALSDPAGTTIEGSPGLTVTVVEDDSASAPRGRRRAVGH